MILSDKVPTLDIFKIRMSKFKTMVIAIGIPPVNVVHVIINHHITTHISFPPQGIPIT